MQYFYHTFRNFGLGGGGGTASSNQSIYSPRNIIQCRVNLLDGSTLGVQLPVRQKPTLPEREFMKPQCSKNSSKIVSCLPSRAGMHRGNRYMTTKFEATPPSIFSCFLPAAEQVYKSFFFFSFSFSNSQFFVFFVFLTIYHPSLG